MSENAIRDLFFRPERSRPVYRNKHTGTEVTVVDLAVNERGGFQGGCRQFVVVTDEDFPPPMRGRGRVWALWSFVEHWEPTGAWIPVDEVAPISHLPDLPQSVQQQSRDEYKREADRYHTALENAQKLIAQALDEGNFS